LRIINKGADSAILNYTVHYHSKNFDKDVQIVLLKTEMLKLNLTFPVPYMSGEPIEPESFQEQSDPNAVTVFALRGSNALNRRTNDPIRRGGIIAGRLPVTIQGNRLKEIFDGQTEIVVTLKDVLEREYSVHFKESRNGTSEVEQKTPNKPPSITNPILQISSPLDGCLPINIPPRAVYTILALHDDLTAGIMTFNNDKGEEWLWPTKEKVFPPEEVRVYRIANHDEVGVFNIKLKFRIDFMVSNTTAIVRSLWQGVQIDQILPGESFSLYVVNQSTKYMALIPFPEVATLQVQGQIEHYEVKLVPKGLIPEIPGMPGTETITLPIQPAQHKWEGGKIIKPSGRG
jgi:hypothetical protein